jgi:DNA-binding transcriptional ArsR family regulator
MSKAPRSAKSPPLPTTGQSADRKRVKAGSTDPVGQDEPSETSPDPHVLHEAAETFAMLSSPTRLHLLWLLSRHEYDVGSLAEAVNTSDAVVSQHLAKLRLADLVTARRQGKRQIYVVDDEHVSSLVEQAIDHHRARRQR